MGDEKEMEKEGLDPRLTFMSCDAGCSWSGGTMNLELGAHDLYVQFRTRMGNPVNAVDRENENRPWKRENGKKIPETLFFKYPGNSELDFMLKTNAANTWVHDVRQRPRQFRAGSR